MRSMARLRSLKKFGVTGVERGVKRVLRVNYGVLGWLDHKRICYPY
jgi:hypothetical protein